MAYQDANGLWHITDVEANTPGFEPPADNFTIDPPIAPDPAPAPTTEHLNIGPGLVKWITDHQATPLSDEIYLSPDFNQSAVSIQIGNAQGQAVHTLVGWDKVTGQIMEPGPGVVIQKPQKTMYDSVTWQAIPADAQMVAGYVDGLYAWPQAAWDRFPNAEKVRIAVFATTNDGDVLDCESGDATPQQCPGWIAMRLAAGVKVPTIYTSLSNVPTVQAACQGLTYDLWIADWTGTPHIPAGAAACQYANPATSGGNWDLSICNPDWPRR